jgi:hypothetical protein
VLLAIEKMKEKLHSKDADRVSVPQFLKAMYYFVDFLIECKEFSTAKAELKGRFLLFNSFSLKATLEILQCSAEEMESKRANEMHKLLLTQLSNVIAIHESKMGLSEIQG